MKLTTKGRVAVTAMLDLAIHESDNPVRLTEISDRQSISLSYLEQLFSQMRRKGLVKSVRGPGGGYLTALDYQTITVKDIIIAVDEKSIQPNVVEMKTVKKEIDVLRIIYGCP